ncbi:MAG: hypothetical protein Q8Q87_01555 [Candidatus Omnitrophota bacterium]|nr:hypothetical protein [Candidatus Omnitrophota bacterium]
MGLKSQYQVSMKQREKRKKKRDRLTAKSGNISEYFYGKYYLKTGKE